MEQHGGGDGKAPSRAGRRSPGLALLLTLVLLTAVRTPTAQTEPAPIDDLIVKAAQQGSLRVIVEVKTDPPGQPRPEAIAQAQDLVLQELAGTRYRVVRRFTTAPFFGLDASADALRRLAASTRVASVREDRLRAPQTAPGSP